MQNGGFALAESATRVESGLITGIRRLLELCPQTVRFDSFRHHTLEQRVALLRSTDPVRALVVDTNQIPSHRPQPAERLHHPTGGIENAEIHDSVLKSVHVTPSSRSHER